MISVSIASEAIRNIKRDLAAYDKKIDRAAMRSVNAAAKKTRTYSSKEIRKEAPIEAKRVNDVMSVKLATSSVRYSTLFVRSQSIPAVYYKGWKASRSVRGRHITTTTKGSRLRKSADKRGGVTVKFTRKGPPHRFKSGFVAVVKAGASGQHLGIFVRKTKKSLPIKEIFAPQVQRLFLDMETKVSRYAQAELYKIYDRQVAYELSK